MAKKKRQFKGEKVAEQLAKGNKTLYLEANVVANEVVTQLHDAMATFSDVGSVGGALNEVAPGILMDANAVLPELPMLTPGQTFDSRRQILHVLLDPEFERVLDGFQKRLVNAGIDQQVALLEEFSSIDWQSLSQPAFANDANFLQKVQGFLYFNNQMSGVKQADLSELLVLTRIPQFVQMLTLAGGYGKVMLVAWKMFTQNRGYLDKDNKDNEALVAELDSILTRFSEAEEKRLSSALSVTEYTQKLQQALEVASALADQDNRTFEMLLRVDLDKQLVTAMGENTEETVKAQLAFQDEYVKSIHLLASNQTRKALVNRAIASLDLYIKCYIVFELVLTMLQVYLLTASTAIQTVLSNRIQTAGKQVGLEFYKTNIAPLQGVVNKYVVSFLPPPGVDADGDMTMDG